jgi:hypothetical protein
MIKYVIVTLIAFGPSFSTSFGMSLTMPFFIGPSLRLCALGWQKQLARLAHSLFLSVRIPFNPLRYISSRYHADYERICAIAMQVLDQKAFCQQDPDQDENEEAPEDQAEYDSILISSAGDLVSALATAYGTDFAQAFDTFLPLIVKYYVCDSSLSAFDFEC